MNKQTKEAIMFTRTLITTALTIFLASTSQAADDVLFDFHGSEAQDFFGTSVKDAGDVNNDGYDDVIVGANGWDGDIAMGYARVFSGKDGTLLREWVGGYAFGVAVAGAGDVNNDGFDDLIIGADGARVYSGKTGGLIYFYADNQGFGVGLSVDTVGDMNLDGYADFIYGAPNDPSGGPGQVFVHSGQNGSILHHKNGFHAGDRF